jgi:hypothetical protein
MRSVLTICGVAFVVFAPLIAAAWLPPQFPLLLRQLLLFAWGVGAIAVAERLLFADGWPTHTRDIFPIATPARTDTPASPPWRAGAQRAYRASSAAFLLFTTAPNPPMNPGFQAGYQRLDQAITLTDADHFSSDAVTQFFDATGHVYREGCAVAVAHRFE